MTNLSILHKIFVRPMQREGGEEGGRESTSKTLHTTAHTMTIAPSEHKQFRGNFKGFPPPSRYTPQFLKTTTKTITTTKLSLLKC